MSNVPGSNRPNPQMDQYRRAFNNLGRGRQLSVGGAVLGLIFSFFPWYGVSYNGPGGFGSGGSFNGWHSWGFLAIIAFLVAGAIVLLPALGVSLRGLLASLPPTVTDARLVLGAGILAIIATLLFIFTAGPSVSGGGFSAGPSFGAYLALICGVAIAVGGYLMQNEPATV